MFIIFPFTLVVEIFLTNTMQAYVKRTVNSTPVETTTGYSAAAVKRSSNEYRLAGVRWGLG